MVGRLSRAGVSGPPPEPVGTAPPAKLRQEKPVRGIRIGLTPFFYKMHHVTLLLCANNKNGEKTGASSDLTATRSLSGEVRARAWVGATELPAVCFMVARASDRAAACAVAIAPSWGATIDSKTFRWKVFSEERAELWTGQARPGVNAGRNGEARRVHLIGKRSIAASTVTTIADVVD
jgi:hypothetical protein